MTAVVRPRGVVSTPAASSLTRVRDVVVVVEFASFGFTTTCVDDVGCGCVCTVVVVVVGGGGAACVCPCVPTVVVVCARAGSAISAAASIAIFGMAPPA
jgi:hypothetical protein